MAKADNSKDGMDASTQRMTYNTSANTSTDANKWAGAVIDIVHRPHVVILWVPGVHVQRTKPEQSMVEVSVAGLPKTNSELFTSGRRDISYALKRVHTHK